MASCPRCGAVNQAGKAACWKCMAPIPSPSPVQQTSSSPPSGPELAAPVRRKLNIPDLTVAFPQRRARPEQPEPEDSLDDEDTDRPALPVAEPAVEPAAIVEEQPAAIIEEEQAPAELAPEFPADASIPTESPADSTDIPRRDKPFARADEDDEEAPAPPAGEFIYVARTTFTRKSTTWIFILVVLGLLVSGIFFLYQHNFRAQPRPLTSREAAEEYLFALRTNQETTRRQLATPDSRGLLLPSWFTITEALLLEVVDTTDREAVARARITLAPIRSITLRQELEHAASQDYDVEFALARGGQYWLADQRALFRSLRRQMKEQNPRVAFPQWNGVSE